MLPDINHVIRRDQKRTFTDAYLRPMRGSSHQFMIFGEWILCSQSSHLLPCRGALLGTFELFRIDLLCPLNTGTGRKDDCNGQRGQREEPG